MKIEPTGTPSSTTPVERTPAEVRQAVFPPSAQDSDAVVLSNDLQLADRALKAAAMAGDVRPEAVAEAIELFNQGRIGADLEQLADRIIDSLTESRDNET
jgi:anti-sigma28 factor (negative regulator of flagellin synthesis)